MTRDAMQTISGVILRTLAKAADRGLAEPDAIAEMGYRHGRDCYWGMPWDYTGAEMAHVIGEYWSYAAAREYLRQYRIGMACHAVADVR